MPSVSCRIAIAIYPTIIYTLFYISQQRLLAGCGCCEFIGCCWAVGRRMGNWCRFCSIAKSFGRPGRIRASQFRATCISSHCQTYHTTASLFLRCQFIERLLEVHRRAANVKQPKTSNSLSSHLLAELSYSFAFSAHHTISVPALYGLREAIAEIIEQTLEGFQERHADNAQRLYEGLINIGLEMFVKRPQDRLPSITSVRIPHGVKLDAVFKYLLDRYGNDK